MNNDKYTKTAKNLLVGELVLLQIDAKGTMAEATVLHTDTFQGVTRLVFEVDGRRGVKMAANSTVFEMR